MGIDVGHYVSRLVGSKREPLLDATGGFPLSLFDSISADLTVFKEYDITPVFVLGGSGVDRRSSVRSTAERHRARAWTAYTQSVARQNEGPLLPTCGDNFREYNQGFQTEALLSDLIAFFIEHGSEYLRAPFLSWAQLGYLYEQGYIHAIYGPTETFLLSNVDKFVLAMDFGNRDFKFVDKSRVLGELGINQTQLVDIAVAVGCDLQPQTLDVFSACAPHEYFDVGISITNGNGSLYGSVAQLPEPQLDAFQKGVMALQFMPVLKTNGRVEIWNFDERAQNQQQPPQDLHEMFSLRLPQEFYFYQSIGLVHNKMLSSIANEAYVEKTPLDGLSLKEYKDLVAAMLPIKAKEVNLLTKNMNRYFQFKTVKYATFWGESMDIPHKPTQNVFTSLRSITLRSETENFSLGEFFKALTNDPLLNDPVSTDPKSPSPQLTNNYEIISTSLLRTFNVFDLYSTKSKSEALAVLQTLDKRFQEQYILLLAFVKLSASQLYSPLSQAVVGDSHTSDPSEKEVVHLISRLATMIQATPKKRASYNGAISRSLLAFRSSIELIHRNIRELLETNLVASLSSDEVSKLHRSRPQWESLVAQLPFGHSTPSTVTAVVVQTILDIFFSGANVAKSQSGAFGAFEFSGLENVKQDVTLAFGLVREGYKLVLALEKDGKVDTKLVEIFAKADILAEQFLN